MMDVESCREIEWRRRASRRTMPGTYHNQGMGHSGAYEL